MTTLTPEDLARTQRRGRIVIVAMVAAFLAVCAVLGVFLWQREQQEARVDDLMQPGLRTVAVPDWGLPPEDVRALEDNRGLVITYRGADGETVPHLRALNLRVGPGAESCELLARAEPDLAQGCEMSGDRLTATSNAQEAPLLAEGRLHDQRLLVLVAHPADATAEELTERLDSAEQMSVRGLLARLD